MNTRKTLKPAALGLLALAALAFTFYAGTQYPIKGDAASKIASREANRPPIMPNDQKADETGEARNPSSEPDDLKADETAEAGCNPVMPDSPNTDATGEASRGPGLPGDPNMITTLQADGTRIVWLQGVDRRTLRKYNFSSDGSLALSSVYRLDPDDNPLNCKIYDDHHTEIYKACYGYRKSDGQLVEEDFFDSRTKHLKPWGDEIPVRRFIFEYDSSGKRSKATAFDMAMPSSAQVDPKTFPTDSFDNPFMSKEDIPKPNKRVLDQPATKPADKAPAEIQPAPTSKEGPR